MTHLLVGDDAPAFTLPQNGGDMRSLSDYAGRNLVLFFYPKDNTPGCTKEAIGFSQNQDAFAALNTDILGVSKDSLKKHDNFVAKQNLTVGLLSDADTQMCEDYGVWGEKQMYGKTFQGIIRSTFLISADGKIARIWSKVKVPGHVDEVLETVRTL